MIIDSSAVMAMLAHESRGADVLDALDRARTEGLSLRMSAATLVEVGVVVDRRKDAVLSCRLDRLLTTLEVEIVEFDKNKRASPDRRTATSATDRDIRRD